MIEDRHTTAEDVRDYERMTFSRTAWIDRAVPGKKVRHYQGALGDFEYDPTEFQIQVARCDASEYGAGGDVEVLRYIGSETDGRKITIPSGIRNTSFMFRGTDLETAPILPPTVQSAFGMYADCKKLKDGSGPMPESLREAEFMYAGCDAMTKAPQFIPGSVKYADYMFTGDAKMQNTPVIKYGVESMNGIFGGCESLTDAPVIPQSVKQANHATYGCPGIDQQKDAEAQRLQEQARARFEKKLDKPTFAARAGSMFSALMQTCALRRMGYGFVMAPFMAYQMRKNGTFSRDFSGGVAALAMGQHGAVGKAIYQKATERSQELKQRQAEQRKERLAQWDRLYGNGVAFSTSAQHMANRGAADAQRGLFLRLPTMETSQKKIYAESHGSSGMYQAQEDIVQQAAVTMTADEKKQVARWYKNSLADKVAYLKEAETAIRNNSSYTEAQRDRALIGLKEMKQLILTPITDSMQRLQAYQLFNDGDQRDIDKMLKGASGKTLFQTNEPAPKQESVPSVSFNASKRAVAAQNRKMRVSVTEPVSSPEPEPDAEPEY